MISYGNRMMHPSIPIGIEDGKYVILTVKGVGGGGSDEGICSVYYKPSTTLNHNYINLYVQRL